MNLPPLKKRSVSIGYTTFKLVGEDELNQSQLGYSVDTEGQSLVGDNDGDWLKDWIVIGYEESCGDPIFVDSSKPKFPVYTAEHGQGSWDPDPVSKTYSGFIQILDKLEILARGREHPAAMEEKPMTQEEYDEFVAFTADTGGIDAALFWAVLLSDDDAGIGLDLSS